MAGLEISGIQLNPITTTEMNALNVTKGYIVFNSTENKWFGYDGTNWIDFKTSPN